MLGNALCVTSRHELTWHGRLAHVIEVEYIIAELPPLLKTTQQQLLSLKCLFLGLCLLARLPFAAVPSALCERNLLHELITGLVRLDLWWKQDGKSQNLLGIQCANHLGLRFLDVAQNKKRKTASKGESIGRLVRHE